MKDRCIFLGGAIVVTSVIVALMGFVMRYTVTPSRSDDFVIAVPIRAMKEFLLGEISQIEEQE